MKRFLLGWFSLTLLWIVAVQPVLAHGYIVRAIPEDRASLERPPTRLQYWFSEALEPDFSLLRLRDQNGQVIATGGVDPENDSLLSLRVPSDLPQGAYVVELRPAFASDGHVVAESRVFFVGAAVGGVAGSAADDSAIPLEVLWKVVNYIAVMLLFGAATLYALVLVPAWGSREHAAGLLPQRVMQRLFILIGLALAAAFVANAVALIQQTMRFFNIGFVQALDGDFINLVRIGSRFGDIWNWRIFFLGLIGLLFLAALYFRERQPENVHPLLASTAWLSALVIGSSSVLSHAAGSLLWPWLGISVDWLHALAVGFWAGGLMALVILLPPALQPYSGEARRLALLAVLRRYSRVAAMMVFIVVATGIYSASNWLRTPDEAQTPFGLALIVKLALAVGLIGLGALHHMALRPERYARWAGLWARVSASVASLRLEALFAALTLAAAAWLSATPVPVPEFASEQSTAPAATQQVADLDVSMTLLPGGPGPNTLDLRLHRDGQPLTSAAVQMRAVLPIADRRGDLHPAEPVEDGLYVASLADIDEAGDWWLLVDIEADTGTQRAAFEVSIRADAAVIKSVDPNALNLLALLGLLLTLALVFYPQARRLLNQMPKDTLTVSVAVSAVIISLLALIGAYVLLQDTREQYDEALRPPPERVNVVLPDQASLKMGQALYESACAAWQSDTRNLAALLDRLPRTRDEELLVAVTEGWRGLPACVGPLEPEQVWHIVNYIRILDAESRNG